MKRVDWNLDIPDDLYFTHDGKPAPDYRAEAFEEAKQKAKTYGAAYVMYNGLYYHVCIIQPDVRWWKRKGYEVIHVERG